MANAVNAFHDGRRPRFSDRVCFREVLQSYDFGTLNPLCVRQVCVYWWLIERQIRSVCYPLDGGRALVRGSSCAAVGAGVSDQDPIHRFPNSPAHGGGQRDARWGSRIVVGMSREIKDKLHIPPGDVSPAWIIAPTATLPILRRQDPTRTATTTMNSG